MFYYLIEEGTGVIGRSFARKVNAVRECRRLAKEGYMTLVIHRTKDRRHMVVYRAA